MNSARPMSICWLDQRGGLGAQVGDPLEEVESLQGRRGAWAYGVL